MIDAPVKGRLFNHFIKENSMSDLRFTPTVDARLALGTRAMTKATLNGTGAAATVTTTGVNTYLVDGIFYSFAAWTVQAVTVTHSMFGQPVATLAAYVQPVLTTAYYVVGLNAAGTVCVVQGSYSGQSIATANGNVVGTGALPVMPDGYAPIGYFKVVLTGAATFTAGTTNWNAAGVTATFKDVSLLPTVPV